MSRRILVVEDDADVLELVVLWLRRNRYTVLTAKTGTMALQRAIYDQPDLIVLDIMLPEMSGIDVCREIRHAEATRHIPIIMLTAKRSEVDRIVGLEMGVDDYVVKPFNCKELVLRIKAVLRRHGLEKPLAR